MDSRSSKYETLFRDSSVWHSIFSLANAIGAGDKEKAGNTSSLCFWSAIGIGLAVSVLLLVFQIPLLRLLGTKPEMWEDAKRYQSVLALGTAFMLLSSSMGMLIRAEGAVKEGLIGNLAGTFTNILLDPLFILVFRWSTTGAAIATVLGNVVSSAYYVFYCLRRAATISLEPKRAFISLGGLLPIAALGLPNAASTVLSGFASTFSNNLLSQHGTDAIAAPAAAGKSSMLAITALGYAGVWMDGMTRMDDKNKVIAELLRVPEGMTVRTIVPLGIPEGEVRQKEKKGFDERVVWNHF